MRYSEQREVILDTLRSTTCHPTAEWVHEQAKKKLPDIGLSTVYRNLVKLEAEGEIIRVVCDTDKERYDGNPKPHGHFVCTKCGEVLDTVIGDDLAAAVLKGAGELSASNFSLVYYGVCPKCCK